MSSEERSNDPQYIPDLQCKTLAVEAELIAVEKILREVCSRMVLLRSTMDCLKDWVAQNPKGQGDKSNCPVDN